MHLPEKDKDALLEDWSIWSLLPCLHQVGPLQQVAVAAVRMLQAQCNQSWLQVSAGQHTACSKSSSSGSAAQCSNISKYPSTQLASMRLLDASNWRLKSRFIKI